ncbi:MAG: methyltransferase [Candidatus Bathyarchaeota archaeon]|nr:MAG: methyltransferase [Candidatus Bathyarchaeota archaeon]
MNSQFKKIFYGKHTFIVSKNVYEPAEDTFLLACHMFVNEEKKVLDMGTGCGILAILAAEKAREVIAVDINPFAVACAKRNAELNGVSTKVVVCLGDLFDAIKEPEKFDLILFNAPYLPVEPIKENGWIEKAWTGGKTGRIIIDRFIGKVANFLTENGRILLVQSSFSNVRKTLTEFLQHNMFAKEVAEKKLPFEKIVLIEARIRKGGN